MEIKIIKLGERNGVNFLAIKNNLNELQLEQCYYQSQRIGLDIPRVNDSDRTISRVLIPYNSIIFRFGGSVDQLIEKYKQFISTIEGASVKYVDLNEMNNEFLISMKYHNKITYVNVSSNLVYRANRDNILNSAITRINL